MGIIRDNIHIENKENMSENRIGIIGASSFVGKEWFTYYKDKSAENIMDFLVLKERILRNLSGDN